MSLQWVYKVCYKPLGEVVRACIFAPESLMLRDDTSRIVSYMCKMVDAIMKATHALVFLVFDGGVVPLKKETIDDRRSRRDEHMRLYHELEAQSPREAREHLVSAFHITSKQLNRIAHEIATNFVKTTKFQLILSPFEADAQVAFLARSGLCDVVISNDSDLVLYGCPEILFGYDPKSLQGRLVTSEDHLAGDFEGMSPAQQRDVCILSGCDYVSSLGGVGLKGAKKALVAADGDILKAAEALLESGKKLAYESMDEYKRLLRAAQICFKHQYVYNVFTARLEPFMTFEKGGEEAATNILGYKFYGDENVQMDSVTAESPVITKKLSVLKNAKWDDSFRSQ